MFGQVAESIKVNENSQKLPVLIFLAEAKSDIFAAFENLVTIFTRVLDHFFLFLRGKICHK